MCVLYPERERDGLSVSHLHPLHPASLHLMETLAKQLARPAGVLHRKVRPSSVQSCDLVLINTGLCSTKLMTSNSSQQKLDSLKGSGEKRLIKTVSLFTRKVKQSIIITMSMLTPKCFQFNQVDTQTKRLLGTNRAGGGRGEEEGGKINQTASCSLFFFLNRH